MNTLHQIHRVLRDPAAEQGGGTQQITIDTPGKATPGIATSTSDQMTQFKASPATAVQKAAPSLPEDVKGKVFDLGDEPLLDYPETKDAASSSDFKKEELKPKEPESKAEPKVEDKKGFNAKLPEKKITQTPGEKAANERDYSMFPEDQREDLKKMSNKAYEYTKSLLLEHQKVKAEHEKIKPEYEKLQQGGMPNQWYEHPEAWRLHPEAQKIQNHIQKIEFEEGFWAEQLERIKEGKKFQILRGYQKNGEPYGEWVEPDENARDEILRYMGQYQSIKQNAFVQLNTFGQTFKNQMDGLNGAVNKIIDQEWPWHKDEKHPAQKWVKEFEDVLPPDFKGQIGFKVAGLLYASYQKALELLAERAQEEKVEETVRTNKAAAEPSVRTATPASALAKANNGRPPGVPVTFNLEGLE